MHQDISLNRLAMDQDARIKALDFSGSERRRMLDLGFREGNIVRPVLKSTEGGPTAYQICGALIALRSCDSERITVSLPECNGGAE